MLDFEPMSSPPTHAVSPVVPAVLALAEARGGSGRDVIAACAKGFEIQGRILAAAKPARGALPFHSPGVMGPMGSAVASAHMLKLDAAQLANALGMVHDLAYRESAYPRREFKIPSADLPSDCYRLFDFDVCIVLRHVG